MASFDSEADRLKDEGNSLFKSDNFEGALLKYREAVRIDANHKAAHLNAGICNRKLGRLEDATTHFVQAISCDEGYVKALSQFAGTLGDIYKLPLPDQNRLLLHCRTCLEEHDLLNKSDSDCVYFMIVDLKLTAAGEVKVLEFGDGIRSGSDVTEETLAHAVRDAIGLPLMLSSKIGDPRPTEVDLGQTVAGWRANRASADSRFVGVYGGLVLKPAPDDVLVINKNVKAVALLDEKVNMHELFHRANLLQYRPTTKVYWRQYHPLLADDICRHFPAGDHVLVKNSDGCRGEGVILVAKSELDSYLRVLLANDDTRLKEEIKCFVSGRPDVVAHLPQILEWLKTQRKVFMVEEIIHSKPVPYEGGVYDPAIRALFLFRDRPELEVPEITQLSCYWKFPTVPTSAALSRGNLISSFDVGALPRSSPVGAEDKALVHAAMLEFLPKVFRQAQALAFDSALQTVTEFPGANFAAVQRQQNYAVQILLANLSGHKGLYAQALYWAYDSAYKNPCDVGQYEVAMAHLLCEDYAQAITKFRSCNSPMKCYRIAMCHRLLGNKAKAQEWISQVTAEMKRDPKVMAEMWNIDNMPSK